MSVSAASAEPYLKSIDGSQLDEGEEPLRVNRFMKVEEVQDGQQDVNYLTTPLGSRAKLVRHNFTSL